MAEPNKSSAVIDIDDEIACGLVTELQHIGFDDRELIQHVCNRLRIKKRIAEPIVRAYQQGRHAQLDQSGVVLSYDGDYAVIFNAAASPDCSARAVAKNDNTRQEQKPASKAQPERQPTENEGLLYSEKEQQSSILLSTLIIACVTFWLTGMTGIYTWVHVVIVTLPWMMIRALGGNTIEGYTLLVIIMILCIAASYSIDNGFPWATLILGFVAVRLAAATRERQHAQRVLNAYGANEVRKIYGDRFTRELDRVTNKE